MEGILGELDGEEGVNMSPTTGSSRLERSISIPAPRARVWRAIAEIAEFSAWFRVKAEGEFAPGARVRMTSTHPGFENVVFWVAIEEVAPQAGLRWRWHPGAAQPPEGSNAPATVVAFQLADEHGGTRVTVSESGFEALPEDRRAAQYEENARGWEYQLSELSRYIAEHHQRGP